MKTTQSTLPVYPSLRAASAATGIPLVALRRASRAGCDAFQNRRVDLERFLTWWFQHADETKDWRAVFDEAAAKREQIRLAQDQDRLVDKEAVIAKIRETMALQFGLLDRIFLAEFPSAAKGLDEHGIKRAAETAIERLKSDLRAAWTRPIVTVPKS